MKLGVDNIYPPYKLTFQMECTLINVVKLTYTNHEALFTYIII